MRRLRLFRRAVPALHRQEQPAHGGKGEAELGQHPQVRHRAGGDDVKPLPKVRLPSVLLRAAVNHGHRAAAQQGGGLTQPVCPLAQAVHQRQADGRLHRPQHQAGKARPGAHVEYPLAGQRDAGGHRGAVEHVQPGHLVRVGDGGQIGHPVPLQQESSIFFQNRGAGRVQSERAQPVGEYGVHSESPPFGGEDRKGTRRGAPRAPVKGNGGVSCRPRRNMRGQHAGAQGAPLRGGHG